MKRRRTAEDPSREPNKQCIIYYYTLGESLFIYIFPQLISIVSLNGGQGATSIAALSRGVLENTGTVPCSASLPTGLPKISTTAGEYFPASDVGFSLSFSIATRNVTSLIDDNPNYAAIRKAFKDLGLGGSADMVRAGEPVYDRFRTHFGSTTWITDYFYGAADGTLSTIEVGFIRHSLPSYKDFSS